MSDSEISPSRATAAIGFSGCVLSGLENCPLFGVAIKCIVINLDTLEWERGPFFTRLRIGPS